MVPVAVRVCLGGTFDRFHVGHEALLAKAFEVGSEVFIGITSQRLAQSGRKRHVQSFETRRRGVMSALRRNDWKGIVTEIDHPYGASLDPKYGAIVVSPETVARAKEINLVRMRKGAKRLRIFVVPIRFGEDGLRISATRIADRQIDPQGRRVAPLRVAVGTANDLKVRAVRDAFQRAFPKLRIVVTQVRVRSRVPAQPLDAQTLEGAEARARGALAKSPKADYGVGVEAGLLLDRHAKRRLDVQYAAVVDRDGSTTLAHGGGFYYPASIEREVMAGRTVSSVLGPLAKDPRLGSTTGAVGYLSKGALDRRELSTHAVLLALVPRIRRELYNE